MLKEKLCVIGSGNMAEALIRGVIDKRLLPPENIFVVNPVDREGAEGLAERYGVNFSDLDAGFKSRIVILTIKPQDIKEAAEMYRVYLGEDHLLVSILAGISTDYLERIFDPSIPIVRTMPNLALNVGESATVYSLGRSAGDSDAALVEEIFKAVGTIKRVKEEEIDAVTAVAGSGPAYIFYLLEAMIDGGCREGLDRDNAVELAVQTVFGTASLLRQGDENPTELRKKIASPGGTTEAALKRLMDGGFKEIVEEAVSEASRRSRELGS